MYVIRGNRGHGEFTLSTEYRDREQANARLGQIASTHEAMIPKDHRGNTRRPEVGDVTLVRLYPGLLKIFYKGYEHAVTYWRSEYIV